MKATTTTQYAELIAALGSTTRLEILLLLIAAHPQGLLSRELQDKLSLPSSTLSHHLDKLRQRSWIESQPDERGTRYTLQVKTLENLLIFFYVESCDRQSLLDWSAIPAQKQRYIRDQLLPRQPEPIGLEGLIDHAIYKRLSGKAMQALLLARSEALRMGHQQIGSEDIVLGLMAEGSGLAATALNSWGLTLEPARRAIERYLGTSRYSDRDLHFDARAQQVLSLALDEATAAGHPLINTEHLLLALIREWQLSQRQERRLGVAAKLLASLGVPPDSMIRLLAEQDDS